MTKQRKLLFLGLVLLFMSVAVVMAQSSANYVVHRTTTLSGGASESANYKAQSVIGQPATGLSDSANYVVSDGFLFPEQDYSDLTEQVWLPLIRR
jgi:hypothetical protein